MNDTYGSVRPKSSDKQLKKEFTDLLELAWKGTPREQPKELAVIIIKQFEHIGYKTGIIGLRRYLNEMFGEKLITTRLIAELGGAVLPKPLTADELPILLTNKVYKLIVSYGPSYTNEVYDKVGELGRELIKRMGGYHAIGAASRDIGLLQRDLERQSSIIIKENPNHRELTALLDESKEKGGRIEQANERRGIEGVSPRLS